MNLVTRNRGPDDEGVYNDGAVSLGHVRLSIIDLSEKGHQPMTNEDGSLWITYNGEIYNYLQLRQELMGKSHHFHSESDTEVLLHAYEEYGLDCFDKFNGMWAFCIYDQKAKQLILSRDRFGIKPLYYYHSGGQFVFSSMITAILEHKIIREPNDLAVMQYLAFNLEQHNEETFFKGINSLLPGHVLTYDLRHKQLEIHRWYHPRQVDTVDEDSLRALFIQSVERRTVADVPVGVCVSGGVDSTAIAAVLNQTLKGSFNTFSLSAPGSPLDETEYIEEVGRHTRTEAHLTTITPDDFLAEIEDFVYAMEEPVTGLSAYAQYRVFKLAHEAGAKVLLDGQGGDELFAGYIYYYAYEFYDMFKKLNWRRLVQDAWYSSRNFNTYFPHCLFLFLLLPEFAKRIVWRTTSVGWVNKKYLHACGGSVSDPRWAPKSLSEILHLTLFSTSIPHNLMWEDKSAMRWSIESRVPFLDVDLVEAALQLSSSQLLQGGQTKVFFKQAISDLLPDKIRTRTDKIGFAAPSDQLMRDKRISRLSKDFLHSDSFRQRPYWNQPDVCRLLDDHIEGRRQIGDTVWKWLNTEMWLQKYF